LTVTTKFSNEIRKAVAEGKFKDFNFIAKKQLVHFHQFIAYHHHYWCMDFYNDEKCLVLVVVDKFQHR
jgi:hypothetical protein